ncbi:DUF695 domain-containing protein [Schlesneria paludicola]|uniref:DUF695 domain-containing protein n=1 Tax=Schlesneria paludicola TaxID=360056 RepID=UPI00029A7996|nr:DUF695 domain-containing protein [Schlesneria paludicola]
MNQSPDQSTTPDDDHWEIYVTYVDDNPAVILVDIGVVESVPITSLPNLVWLWIHLKTTDEDGFPSEEEDFRLNEIEDLVTEGMGDLALRYVGRITTDGRREFYFYTDDPEQFRQSATAAMSSVSEYEFEIDVADDPEWSHYQNVLYPSPEDFQQIQNQQVISQLQQAGDSLTEPRPVDHYANFRTAEDRDAFIAAAAAEGYESVSRPDRTDDEGEFPFSVGLLRVDPVDPETIDRITFELFDLARQHTGEYEGWGSKVVKS